MEIKVIIDEDEMIETTIEGLSDNDVKLVFELYKRVKGSLGYEFEVNFIDIAKHGIGVSDAELEGLIYRISNIQVEVCDGSNVAYCKLFEKVEAETDEGVFKLVVNEEALNIIS